MCIGGFGGADLGLAMDEDARRHIPELRHGRARPVSIDARGPGIFRPRHVCPDCRLWHGIYRKSMSRYRGIFFGMLNLGISMVFFSLAGKLYTLTGGTDGLRFDRPRLLGMALGRGNFEWSMVLLALLLAALLGWMVQRYFRSSAGQIAIAIRTNETRLEYIGLSARASLIEAYVLSSALVGVGGALLALAQGLVTPESGYWLRSGEYVFIAILGGAGHAIGAFLGAAAFELILLAGSAYFTNIWQIVLGLTLLLVIFFAPSGLVGRFQALRLGATTEDGKS
jgi:branched-chain amino acid transport system permease protein